MSQPTFPQIDPPLTREGSLNEIISSIAAEELSLSHILNAEGEKLQYVLGTLPGLTEAAALDEVMKVNESVQSTLSGIVEQQMLLSPSWPPLCPRPSLPAPRGLPVPRGPRDPPKASPGPPGPPDPTALPASPDPPDPPDRTALPASPGPLGPPGRTAPPASPGLPDPPGRTALPAPPVSPDPPDRTVPPASPGPPDPPDRTALPASPGPPGSQELPEPPEPPDPRAFPARRGPIPPAPPPSRPTPRAAPFWRRWAARPSPCPMPRCCLRISPPMPEARCSPWPRRAPTRSPIM